MCCPMPSTTNQFGWSDRDTVARNMLQFATYAPPSIRIFAIQLLQAFGSPVILPELKQIALDERGKSLERHYAFRAIASIPGDIYLPEFEHFIVVNNDAVNLHDFLALLIKHPSNFQWVLRSIEQLPPKDYLDALDNSVNYFHKGSDLNPILCQRITEVIEHNPLFLNIDHIETLYVADKTEAMLNWLHGRWSMIIDLCELEKIDRLFWLLGDWDELREALFQQCPSCMEEYEQKKQKLEIIHSQAKRASVEYQSSLLWQELNGWYQAALEGDQHALGNLTRVVKYERKNLSKRAVATNLLGKLKDKYDVRPALFHALRTAPDDSQYQQLLMGASIRFEAGQALRDIPLPDVWETMVDAFFIRPRYVLEDFMVDWIAHLTDRLSGIETPYSGMEWRDENWRCWFRALADKRS